MKKLLCAFALSMAAIAPAHASVAECVNLYKATERVVEADTTVSHDIAVADFTTLIKRIDGIREYSERPDIVAERVRLYEIMPINDAFKIMVFATCIGAKYDK